MSFSIHALYCISNGNNNMDIADTIKDVVNTYGAMTTTEIINTMETYRSIFASKHVVNTVLYKNEHKMFERIEGTSPPRWELFAHKLFKKDKEGEGEGGRRTVIFVDLGNVHDVCENVNRWHKRAELRPFAEMHYRGSCPINTLYCTHTHPHGTQTKMLMAIVREIDQSGPMDIFICSKHKLFHSLQEEYSEARKDVTIELVHGWDELKLHLG